MKNNFNFSLTIVFVFSINFGTVWPTSGLVNTSLKYVIHYFYVRVKRNRTVDESVPIVYCRYYTRDDGNFITFILNTYVLYKYNNTKRTTLHRHLYSIAPFDTRVLVSKTTCLLIVFTRKYMIVWVRFINMLRLLGIFTKNKFPGLLKYFIRTHHRCFDYRYFVIYLYFSHLWNASDPQHYKLNGRPNYRRRLQRGRLDDVFLIGLF